MRGRLVLGAALVGVLLVGHVRPADANTETRDADARSDGSDAEANAGVVNIGDGADVGGGGGRRSGGSLDCTYYFPLLFPDPGGTFPQAGERPDADAVARGLVEGQDYLLICDDESGQEVVNRMITYDPADPVAGIDPEVLAEEAAARLSVAAPSVETSPKTGVNQIVQLPTWMWVTNWEPDSATASVPGVSATVTATPTTVTWDMGNGDQEVCSGPGTPFDFARSEESQSTDCSYTYRHSSTSQPGGVYQVSATMSYDVSWSAEGAPGGGALPTVSETSTFPVRVIEIHAVEGVGTGAG